VFVRKKELQAFSSLNVEIHTLSVSFFLYGFLLFVKHHCAARCCKALQIKHFLYKCVLICRKGLWYGFNVVTIPNPTTERGDGVTLSFILSVGASIVAGIILHFAGKWLGRKSGDD